MSKNCKRSLLHETSYINSLRKMDEKLFDQTCVHVHLLNILEDQCNHCSYCKFVMKLKESLEKNGFFLHPQHC